MTSKTQLLFQKLTGICDSLKGIPASQLHQSVSEDFARNYNNARRLVIATHPDLTEASPPEVTINPDRSIESSYLDVLAYCSELQAFIRSKTYEELPPTSFRKPGQYS